MRFSRFLIVLSLTQVNYYRMLPIDYTQIFIYDSINFFNLLFLCGHIRITQKCTLLQYSTRRRPSLSLLVYHLLTARTRVSYVNFWFNFVRFVLIKGSRGIVSRFKRVFIFIAHYIWGNCLAFASDIKLFMISSFRFSYNFLVGFNLYTVITDYYFYCFRIFPSFISIEPD